VTGLALAALSLPATAALTQLRRVCSTRPSSRAAGPGADLLRSLDSLFLELGRVLLLRYLLHLSSFQCRC
jgi:hypothetical protein